MSKPLNIGGTIYNYPEAHENSGWGEDATGWAQAVTDTLNGIISEADIPITTASIDDGVSIQPVIGLLLNNTVVRGATVEYIIYRTSSAATKAEKGTLEVVWDGSSWQMTRGSVVGDGAIDLDINDITGQVTYTSSTMGGTGYSGIIKFKSSALIQS